MYGMTRRCCIQASLLVICIVLLSSCTTCATTDTVAPTIEPTVAKTNTTEPSKVKMKEPLITHMFTADPSAHVFEGKLYIYPSHDRDSDAPSTMSGDQYDMEDYHVFSLDDMQSSTTTGVKPDSCRSRAV